MGLTKVRAAGAAALTTESLREQVRLAETEWNDKLDAIGMAALEWAEALTGRAILTSTVTLTLKRFPPRVRLPYPPLVSVDSVAYLDDGGSTQVLAEGLDYEVASNVEPAVVAPPYGLSWPTPIAHLEPVTITYTAGYGSDPTAVPRGIREAMLLKAEELFGGGDPATVRQLAETAMAVIRPFRLGELLVFPDDCDDLEL